MPRLRRVAALGVVVSVLALAACTASPGGPTGAADEPSTVESLWSARTAYVGDSSRVVTVVGEAGFTALGEHTISLQTKAEPYGLTIDLDAQVTEADVSGPATLVLGLVGNLAQVVVVVGEDEHSYTTETVSEGLGYDVKELGADQERLGAYVEAHAGES